MWNRSHKTYKPYSAFRMSFHSLRTGSRRALRLGVLPPASRVPDLEMVVIPTSTISWLSPANWASRSMRDAAARRRLSVFRRVNSLNTHIDLAGRRMLQTVGEPLLVGLVGQPQARPRATAQGTAPSKTVPTGQGTVPVKSAPQTPAPPLLRLRRPRRPVISSPRLLPHLAFGLPGPEASGIADEQHAPPAVIRTGGFVCASVAVEPDRLAFSSSRIGE